MKTISLSIFALATMFVFNSTAQNTTSKTQPLSVEPNTESAPGSADDEAAKRLELAKKLQNPVANLISVPIQNNWDFGIGPANAMRYTANIQPVIPFKLTEDWNVITRTIVPIISAEPPVVGRRPAGA